MTSEKLCYLLGQALADDREHDVALAFEELRRRSAADSFKTRAAAVEKGMMWSVQFDAAEQVPINPIAGICDEQYDLSFCDEKKAAMFWMGLGCAAAGREDDWIVGHVNASTVADQIVIDAIAEARAAESAS